MTEHRLSAGTIYEGDFLTAPIEPGHTLAILDGPYAMGKAAWDRMKVDALPDWYAPHLARVSALLAPSASMYVWNTAEGWARLDPGIRALGWTFRALITWDKGIASLAGKIDTEGCRTWPDVTEVCGFYQREGIEAPDVAFAAGADDRNWVRLWLCAERDRAAIPLGRLKRLIDEAGGAGEMLTRHSFYTSQWLMPTVEQWTILHRVWNEHGDPAGRPYLQRQRSEAADAVIDLKAGKAYLRAEYEAMRAPFVLPPGITNVWTAAQVSGAERLKGPTGAALHPCQKPLAFAERMIRASTRPGERVLVPFGGTCREAVICEWLARSEPEEVRRYDVVELNADGVDYLGPVLAQIRGEDPRQQAAGQVPLFGRTP